jgi:hypothetical protein
MSRSAARPHRHQFRFVVAALATLLLASGCTLVSGTPALDQVRQVFEAPAPAPADPAGTGQGSNTQGANPAPVLQPVPTQERSRPKLKPRPRKGRFEMDLYGRNDHVPQYTSSWCVGASMQMMINMMEPGAPDRRLSTQRRLYRLAREVSPWVEERPGASTYGWAGGLERLGYGRFVEMASGSKQGALRIAARQMRLTGRPVGLLVWEGEHAWVMSGFKATADPAWTDNFTVTAVWIEDPWAGRASSAWGRGLAPHSLVTVRNLRGFVRWESFHRPEYGRRGKFTIVAPVEDLA